jgi:hypothetical protein
MINSFLFNGFFIFLQRIFGSPLGPALLQENGYYLLQETGDKILLE